MLQPSGAKVDIKLHIDVVMFGIPRIDPAIYSLISGAAAELGWASILTSVAPLETST